MSAPNPPVRRANVGRLLAFTDHLQELRVRIIICMVWFFLAFAVSLWYSGPIVGWLIRPLTSLEDPAGDRGLVMRAEPDGTVKLAGIGSLEDRSKPLQPVTTATLAGLSPDRAVVLMPHGGQSVRLGRAKDTSLHFLSPIEPFMLLMKGATLAAATASLPLAVYQLWLFIAPGLLRRERKAMRWLLLSVMLLFPAGALFAYWVCKICLHFLLGMAASVPGLTPSIVASKYVGFVLVLMIVFGVVFEFPVVLVLLSRIGLIDAAWLTRNRRTAYVAITAVAAFGIPSPDPFSMVALMVPCGLLYEASIWAVRSMERAAKEA